MLRKSKEKSDRFFKLDPSGIANPVVRGTLKLTGGLIEKSLGFRQLDAIYRRTCAMDETLTFAQRAMRAMNVTIRVAAEGERPIPIAGPVVVVANHPFGGVEGILLLALLERARPDVKVMANYLLSCMPEARSSFIFVDPFGRSKSASSNVRPMKESLSWLKQGGMLGVFPAGEVSSVDLRSGKVRDPAWSPTIASIVRRTQASVLPVYFTGHNGPIFNLAGMIHPRLRTMMLPQQLINKQNRELTVEIGQPIAWREMSEYTSDGALIQYLRLRTYILAERTARRRGAGRRLRDRLFPRRRAAAQAPIIAAVAPPLLTREIAALPASQELIAAGEMRVFHARAPQIPALLREIGRLREITFRAIGEGTGKAVDLDEFDDTYEHLFIWNQTTAEIVGAYRLGLADEIEAQQGVKGLYTHTCFRFNHKLMRHLQPAIELGRSFVRPEYQKAYSSLLLLWRGISAFICRHPHYTHLFGPVSITNEYHDASRNLMLRSLRLSNFEHDLARLVRPRQRPRRPRRAEWSLPDFHPYIDNIDLVSRLIQEIENDQKGIPILLRQYLKLGGKLLAFNVDPNFSSSLDGLIAVDLTRTDVRTLRRYMGTAEADAYFRHHGVDPDALAAAHAARELA